MDFNQIKEEENPTLYGGDYGEDDGCCWDVSLSCKVFHMSLSIANIC